MGKPRGRNGREHMSQCGQRTSFNRTRVAGHLDEIQGVMANTLNGAHVFRNGVSLLAKAFGLGFID
jgi:hypothetical protein